MRLPTSPSHESPTVNDRLPLHQELLLLALQDEKGVAVCGTMYEQGLAGCVVAELILRERVSVAEEKKKFVDVLDGSPTGDGALDEALGRMAAAKRRATVQTWVGRLGGAKLKHLTARELCRRKVLREDEGKVLLFFTRKVYPERDPGPEREIRKRLERAIFSDSGELDPRTVVLISVCKASGLLAKLFTKQRLKPRKARIERIVAGDVAGQATREAVQAIHTAIFVAAMVPIFVAN